MSRRPPCQAASSPDHPRKTPFRHTPALHALLVALSLAVTWSAAGWQQIGPEWGSARDLDRVAGEPATVFAGGLAGGLFRSSDGGRTWTSLLASLPVPGVPEVAVGPQGETVVAVTEGDELWHSADGGDTWSRATVVAGGIRGLFRDVVVAAADPSVAYVGGQGALRSVDGGATWEPADGGRTDVFVLALAVHPADADVVFAATTNAGLQHSEDGGDTWRQVLPPTNNAVFTDVAFDPTDPDTVYTAGSAGVRVSRDGGATWSDERGPAPLELLVVDPETPGRAWVVAIDSTPSPLGAFRYVLHRVEGYGASFEPLREFALGVRAVLPAVGAQPMLIGQDQVGVRQVHPAADGGIAVPLSNRGRHARPVTGLGLSPQVPSTVLATVEDPVSLVRSRDGGARFPRALEASLDLPATRVVVRRLVPKPTRPADAYVLASTSVILGADRDPGAINSPASQPLAGARPYALAVHPQRPRRLFVLTRGGADVTSADRLFVSEDGGETWRQLLTPAEPRRILFDLALDPHDPDRLFVSLGALDGGRLLVSEDAGETFTSLAGPRPPAPLAVLQAYPDRAGDGVGTALFALTTDGRIYVRALHDGGWLLQEKGLPAGVRAVSLDASPNGDGEIVVGTDDGRVFRSAVPGTPYEELGAGLLPALPVEEVALVPDSGIAFARVGGALWRHGVADDCDPEAPDTLCLRDGRFAVEVDWETRGGKVGEGRVGVSFPLLRTDAWGWLWFFRQGNAELAVKLLDGRPVNSHWWVFYASMTDVAFDLRVTDVEAGAFRVYRNPSGRLASRGDTAAFAPGPVAGTAAAETSPPGPVVAASDLTPRCGGGTPLCLHGGRFRVEAEWEVPGGATREGGSGDAVGQILSADSGYLWFFRQTNPELFVKVLDGRPVNGKWWVFYGSLTDVGYRLTVTDLLGGESRTYEKAPGTFASGADTGAF